MSVNHSSYQIDCIIGNAERRLIYSTSTATDNVVKVKELKRYLYRQLSNDGVEPTEYYPIFRNYDANACSKCCKKGWFKYLFCGCICIDNLPQEESMGETIKLYPNQPLKVIFKKYFAVYTSETKVKSIPFIHKFSVKHCQNNKTLLA